MQHITAALRCGQLASGESSKMNLLRNVRNSKVKCNLLNKSADEKFYFLVTRNYLLLIMKVELIEDNTKARH